MPYLKKGGPLGRLPPAQDLSQLLDKMWVVNRDRPYFPTYISNLDTDETWKMPTEIVKKMITQLQEYSGGSYYIDDPSPYESDDVGVLKRLYDQYMQFLKPVQSPTRQGKIMKLRKTLVLNHGDDVSGTTHYDSGHISYWSGNSANIVVSPDGTITAEDIVLCDTPLATAIRDSEEEWPDDLPIRNMLPGEEALHDAMRRMAR